MSGELHAERQALSQISQVALLGHDLASGALSAGYTAARVGQTMLALNTDSNLRQDLLEELALSDEPLLPTAIKAISSAILMSGEDESVAPATLVTTPEDWRKGDFEGEQTAAAKIAKLLRVFLIGLEKGGYDRRSANDIVRQQIDEPLFGLIGSTSYTDQADFLYLYTIKEKAGLSGPKDLLKLVGAMAHHGYLAWKEEKSRAA